MALGKEPQNELPVLPVDVFAGYQRKVDSTKMPYNTLTYPSVNVIIPASDKIIPRGDSLQQGQNATGNYQIVGHAKKFRNLGGDEMEVRVWKAPSGDNRGDVVEVLYTNPLSSVTKYWPITLNTNPLTRGVNERYYFAEWQDTNLGGISLNLKRLLWVDGTNTVKSWVGGIAPISAITATTITTTETWASLGFIDPADGGTGKFSINGVEFTGLSGWNTNTITVASTAGITANADVAFSIVEQDTTTVELDNVNSTYKNYAIYGNTDRGNFYMSNAFNRIATQLITATQAVQNDMIVTGSYNGSGSHVIRYQIDQICPVSKRYFLQPSGAVDNMAWIETDYSLNNRNTYRVVIVDDTAGSEKFDLYKNGTLTAITNEPITTDQEQTLIDGLSIVFTDVAPVPYVLDTAWTLIIGGRDTYAWYLDNVLQASGINVTTALVYSGVNMKPQGVRGHSKGDFWEVTVDQEVTRAWANFYYGLPRKPGEGYVGNLPSNFWAICSQEGVTYINCSHGEWQYIETILSADLLTETVNIVPLKQSSSNKMLYPYMFTNDDNDLIFLNERRAIASIGRKELVELPQVSNISDLVKLDLLEMSFTGASSMEYWDAKLWISSPTDGKMMVFDNAPTTKYWQPPQSIPECGIMSVVGTQLIAHSSIRNVTNQIMLPTRGKGDNSSAFSTRIRTAFNIYDNRWNLNCATATFIEGRMVGLSNFYYDVVAVNENQVFTRSHLVVPTFSILSNRAPLGAGSISSHPLGMDVPEEAPPFREIYLFDPIRFYYSAIDLSCDGLGQNWEIYSIGLNTYDGDLNNQLLVSNQNVV